MFASPRTILPDIVLPTEVYRPAEAERLQELARGQVVLECGTFSLSSVIVLASVAAQVHSINWQPGALSALPEYLWGLGQYDIAERVAAHAGPFDQILLRSASFDGCLVDGQLERPSIEQAVGLVRRVVRRPGWVAVRPHVQAVVDAFASWPDCHLESVTDALVALRFSPSRGRVHHRRGGDPTSRPRAS